MRLRRFLLLFVLCVIPLMGLARTHTATCSQQGLQNLVVAKRGGFWSKDKQHGFYRILVYRYGWEHTQDEVQFQTMLLDEQQKKTKALRCVVMQKPSSSGSTVKGVRIKVFRKNLTLVTIMTYVRRTPGLIKRTVYVVKPDGKFVKIMETHLNQTTLNKVYNRQGL